MIIRQTTTIVFEYPQDYLQEQEWCKTKDDRWVHKSTDTLGAVYENTISYSIGVTADRKTEPQYDFDEYADRLWKIAYERGKREALEQTEPQNYCDDCLYRDTCDSKEFFYACTSKATISKMEQVEDEPQTERSE